MRVFFLDPAARLWLIECDGTHDFYEDQQYDPNVIHLKQNCKNGDGGDVNHSYTLVG